MNKTVKHKYRLRKCNNLTKKHMIGGGYIEISPSLVSKTKNVLEQTRNYLEINDRNYSYYTKVAFSKDMTQISNWANYGLNPGLDGVFVERLQPYIIYLIMYYYVTILFSQLFSRNNNILLYRKLKSNIELVDKDEMGFSVDTEYYMYASIQLMDNVMTVLNPKSNMVVKFKFTSPYTDPLLSILDIYIVNNGSNETTEIRNTIEQLVSGNLKSIKSTSDTFTNELRKKTLSILKNSTQSIQRIITKQISSSLVEWIIFDDVGEYTLTTRHRNAFLHKIEEYINSNFIIVLSQLENIISKASETSKSVKSSSYSSTTPIIENPIPSVLNIYLSSTSPTPVKIDNMLLTSDMLIPNYSSKDNLRINPRNPLKKMNSVLKEFCKTNKIENPITVFFDKKLFLKFNSMYDKKTRVRTLKQAIETNLTDNISNTIQLLLSGSELQVTRDGNKERLKINSYFWNNQWYLTGPRDVLLSIDTNFLQSTPTSSPNPSNMTKCYSDMIDVLNDLVDLFYPSMAGKEISKSYTKYLQSLNERNILVNDVKHLIDKERLSISTNNISEKYKDTLSNIRAKSINLKSMIKEFVKNIIYQLVIIEKMIVKIINRIQTNCFVYYVIGHDFTNVDTTVIGPVENKLVASIINPEMVGEKSVMSYLSFLEEGYNRHDYLSMLSCSKGMVTQYSDISSAYDTVVTTVMEELNDISQRMITITNNDDSNTTINISKEGFDELWISNEKIEKCFTTLESVLKSFIQRNLTPEYYSQEYIEKSIDDILWDMEMSNTITYSRLFTSFVDKNIWNQFELLFVMKSLQYIFLIYKYTGKYVAYYNIDTTKINLNQRLDSFADFLSPDYSIPFLKSLNLFSYTMNWFKYICLQQILALISKKGGNINVGDIQELFITDINIKHAYAILKYYVVNIILSNIDVCQLSNELQSLISILAPTDVDLKQYARNYNEAITNTSQTETPNSSTKTKPTPEVKNVNELAFNVVVQVNVSKEDIDTDKTNNKLNGAKSYNIDGLLGCKRLALGMKWDKLKHSTNAMVGNSIEHVTNVVGRIFEPNLSPIEDDLSAMEKKMLKINDDNDKSETIKKVVNDIKNSIIGSFKSPQYQILVSVPDVNIDKTNNNGRDLGINVDKIILELTKLGNRDDNKSLSRNKKDILDTVSPTLMSDKNISTILSSLDVWSTLV